MTPDDRRRLRAALKIHEALTRRDKRTPSTRLPLDVWRDLEGSARRAALAEQRAAACLRVLDADERPREIPSPRELLADLLALEAEFDEVAVDLKEQTLSVTTDPVVLEGIDLGRFRVLLRWGEEEGPDSDVVALDPHPAASDETASHPHVRDEGLCEGEGRTPIRRALAEGRLYDLFLLVRQVLATYNPGSAYVPLSRWSGSPCTGCGITADEDESTSCERCGDELCLDCSTGCGDCGRTCCSDCRDRCGDCREADESGDDEPDDTTPPHEEHDDHPRTGNPASDVEDETTTDAAGPPAVTADAAVQPLRLGEAAVPA